MSEHGVYNVQVAWQFLLKMSPDLFAEWLHRDGSANLYHISFARKFFSNKELVDVRVLNQFHQIYKSW